MSSASSRPMKAKSKRRIPNRVLQTVSSSSTSSGTVSDMIDTKSAEDLLRQAERYIEECNPDAAIEAYQEVLSIRPYDTTVMDAMGEVYFDMGEDDKARDMFQTSAKLAPTSGHSKWMHLGQMAEGKAAVESYQRGITILEAKLTALAEASAASAEAEAASSASTSGNSNAGIGLFGGSRSSSSSSSSSSTFGFGSSGISSSSGSSATFGAGGGGEGSSSTSSNGIRFCLPQTSSGTAAVVPLSLQEDPAVLRRELSNAYCSIVEAYTTDLCDEEEAEEMSERASQAALDADSNNPEAFSVAASTLLSKSKPAEAIPLLHHAFTLLQAFTEEDGEDEDDDDGNEEDEDEDEGNDNSGSRRLASVGIHAVSGTEETGEANAITATKSADDLKREKLLGIPPYNSRLLIAKMCLEVELNTEAATLFENLLMEDDTNMEVWFLVGEALFHIGQLEEAEETVATALAMVKATLSCKCGPSGKPKKNAPPVKAASVHSVAIATAPSNGSFSFEAIETLVQTSVPELDAMEQQFSKLLEVISAAVIAAGGTSVVVGTGSGGGGSGSASSSSSSSAWMGAGGGME